MATPAPDLTEARAADKALVDRILAGEEQAFAELVETHHASMLRLAHAYVSSTAVATEVVQETWMAVLKGLARFEGRAALKTWIFRILTNRAKTRGVKEGRSIPFTAMEPEDREPAVDPAQFSRKGSWTDSPSQWEGTTHEDMLERKQAMQALKEALEHLPPQQRLVVTMRDVEGLDSKDVCNVLEISETNQRVLLHRGRSKLRRLLDGHLVGS